MAVTLTAVTLMAAGLAPAALAENLVFRFEAERRQVPIQPPEGSVAALAANAPSITGTFGFSTDAPIAARAGIPGRIEFASYDTGFIAIDEVDVGPVPGSVSLRVGNGIPQSADPKSTIDDDLILGFRAVSPDEPIDSVSLRLRYRDAEMLQSVAIPTSLDYGDFGSVRLSFSHRIDAMSDRSRQASGTSRVLGLVHFDVTAFERVE
jgi:hypothetical protein